MSTKARRTASDRFNKRVARCLAAADQMLNGCIAGGIRMAIEVPPTWMPLNGGRGEMNPSTTPAAQYDRKTQTIYLHPHLKHANAPGYVLLYVLFQQCVRHVQMGRPMNERERRAELLSLERRAPEREKAIAWLNEHGYPVGVTS